MRFIPHHPKATLAHMGHIPSFLSDAAPGTAKDQLNRNYIGGWHPFEGFTMDAKERLLYPDDPPTRPIAELVMRSGERVVLYEHSWVAVIQSDGSFEVSRMD